MKRLHGLVYFSVTMFAIVSFTVATVCWDYLPNIIPVHFGFNGQADSWAEKSLLYVFFIPVLQLFMITLFAFLYKKPQYSNMPSTMWLMSLGKKERDHAFGLMRNMQTGVIFIISILFTYLSFAINLSAVDGSFTLSPLIMIFMIICLLAWSTYWSVVIYRITKKDIKSLMKKSKGKI